MGSFPETYIDPLLRCCNIVLLEKAEQRSKSHFCFYLQRKRSINFVFYCVVLFTIPKKTENLIIVRH